MGFVPTTYLVLEEEQQKGTTEKLRTFPALCLPTHSNKSQAFSVHLLCAALLTLTIALSWPLSAQFTDQEMETQEAKTNYLRPTAPMSSLPCTSQGA